MVSEKINDLSWNFMASQLTMGALCLLLMWRTDLREFGIAVIASSVVISISIFWQILNHVQAWPWCGDSHGCSFSKSHVIATLISLSLNIVTISVMTVVNRRLDTSRTQSDATIASTVCDEESITKQGDCDVDLESAQAVSLPPGESTDDSSEDS